MRFRALVAALCLLGCRTTEETTVVLLPLSHRPAAEVAGAVRDRLARPEEVRIEVDPRRNALLVLGPRESVAEVERLSAELDRP